MGLRNLAYGLALSLGADLERGALPPLMINFLVWFGSSAFSNFYQFVSS